MSAIGRLRLLFIQPLEEEENGRDARAVKFFPPLQSSTRFRHESLWIGLDANCRSNPYLPSTSPIPFGRLPHWHYLGLRSPFRSDHIHISLRHSPFAILSASHTTHDAPPVSVTRQLLSITHPRDPGFQFHYHSLISFKRVYWGIGDNPHKFTAIITSLHSPRYRPGEVSSILVSSYHITSLPSSYYAAKSFC